MVLSVASYHIRACFSTDGVSVAGSAARYINNIDMKWQKGKKK